MNSAIGYSEGSDMHDMKVKKVEQGLEGDDFVHDRRTLRVELINNEIYPCKLYPDGRLRGFHSFFLGDEHVYEEHNLDPELEKEIREAM